jgi:kinesin family protein 13
LFLTAISPLVGHGGAGAADAASAEELLAVKMKLQETESLIAEMTMTWEERLRQSDLILREHHALLSEHGASVSGGGNALKLASQLPHFVSLSTDLDFDITIYTLKFGTIIL